MAAGGAMDIGLQANDPISRVSFRRVRVMEITPAEK